MNKVNSDGLCGTVYQAWWSIDAWLRLADADGDVSGKRDAPKNISFFSYPHGNLVIDELTRISYSKNL